MVRPLGVVVVDVLGHGAPGFLGFLEGMDPGAFFFEGADESLAQAVLFRGIGGDIFLL